MLDGFSIPDADLVTQVSFLTAALMAVALCFHSVLEVRPPSCHVIGVDDWTPQCHILAESELAQDHTSDGAWQTWASSGALRKKYVAGNGDGCTGQHR